MKKLLLTLAVLCGTVSGWAEGVEILGATKIPEQRVDLSQGLETGYYLLKQVNEAGAAAGGQGVGWIMAASEQIGAEVTSKGTAVNPTNNSLFVWYVEVDANDETLISISTANKVAGWDGDLWERKRPLVAHGSKLKYHTGTVNLSGDAKPKEGSCFLSNINVTAFVHFSGDVLGSWHDTNIGSMFMVEFYRIPEEDLLTPRKQLKDYIAKASASLGNIALQTTNVNAAGYLSCCGVGDGALHKMIDGNNNTYYASPWQSAVGQKHYWQVDLGEGASPSQFKFAYVTRPGAQNTPTSITVLGSNDGVNFDKTLADFNENLPQGASASYTSGVIENPEKYRYLRFEGYDDEGGYSFKDGETTIGLAEFMLYKGEASWSDQDKAVEAAIVAAQNVYDDTDATLEEINDAIQNVIAAVSATVEKPSYPFIITTDDANPVLYAIKSGRTNEGKEWWYTYTGNNEGKIKLAQYTGEVTQLWFFKEVFTEDFKYALQLYPYADPTKAMSYENTGSGADKIVAKVPGPDWKNLWFFVSTNGVAPYGLQTYDMNNYLSNNGGHTNKMGMWDAAPSSDAGTAMYFSEPAVKLQALIDNAKEIAKGKGTTIGKYSIETIEALEAAITEAEGNLANKNYSVNNLNAAIAGVQLNVPATGKFYRLKNAVSGNYMCGNVNNITVQTAEGDANGGENRPATIFYLGENNTLLSYSTGLYLDCNAKGYAAVGTSKNGTFAPAFGGCQENVIAYSTDGCWLYGNYETDKQINKNTATLPTDIGNNWIFEEVTYLPVKVSSTLKFGTLYSPVALSTTEQWSKNKIKAYTGVVNEDRLVLSEISGDIPANTPVIVEYVGGEQAHDCSYLKVIASANPVTVENDLRGDIADAYKEGDAYVLANTTENGVGLYKAMLNFTVAENGTATKVTENGTHFLNNGFKAYLPKPESSEARFFLFDFGGNETAIESVEGENENAKAVVYDLAGRRVQNAQKGVFIVNGKVVVK